MTGRCGSGENLDCGSGASVRIQCCKLIYTRFPTESPTRKPTESPTKKPTESPTKKPTETPTKKPTFNPSETPTKKPTQTPTVMPTKTPTEIPTKTPTKFPTKNPTSSPSKSPTKFPTEIPTKNPTRTPSLNPSMTPTFNPSQSPSISPTICKTDFRSNYNISNDRSNIEYRDQMFTVTAPNTTLIAQVCNNGNGCQYHCTNLLDCFDKRFYCDDSSYVICCRKRVSILINILIIYV